MIQQESVYYINGKYPDADMRLALQLQAMLAELDAPHCPVILCIGTDRVTGDSLGPLAGSFLEAYGAYHPLTVYGTSANANLRNSLAGGLGLQYADRDLGADEKAFYGEKMSAVVLFQDACLSDPEANAVLSSTRDTAENLDFALLDTTAQQLAAWVIERGDEPLNSHVVYW